MIKLKRKINYPYRSYDKYAITDNAYLIQNAYIDDSGSIRKRPGTEVWFDFSTISSTYATKGIDGRYWFQERQTLIVVINGDIYEFSTLGGTYTKIGTGLLTAGTPVTFDKVADGNNSNAITLFMANGGKPVYYNGTTCDYVSNNANYAGAVPTTVTHVAAADQTLFCNDNSAKSLAKYATVSQPFKWNQQGSTPYDTPAQAITDDISGLYPSNGLIWIQGADSIEPIQNTGRTPPWIRVHRGLVETGTVNPYAIGLVNKTAFFLNSKREISYLDGFNPIVISQPYSERIQKLSSTLDVQVDVQTGIGGRTFIIFNFKDAGTSIVYDYSLKELTGKNVFYEWGKWDDTNQKYLRYPYQGYAYCSSWNFHIIGGVDDGKLYRLRDDKYTDSGTNIRTEIITGIYGDEDVETKASDGLFRFRRGDGLDSNNNSNAYAYIQYRKNMQNEWQNRIKYDLGNAGDSKLNNTKLSLGSYYTIQYRVLHTDDSPFVLHGITEQIKA